MSTPTADLTTEVRRRALAAAGTSERPGPAWCVGDTEFALLTADGERPGLTFAAPAGVADEMVAAEPRRFAHAAGRAGWLTLWLDGTGDDAPDLDEVDAVLAEARSTVAAGSASAGAARPGDGALPGAPGRFAFRSRIWRHSGNAAWHFLTLPVAVAASVHRLPPPVTRGFGSRKVRVTIGSTTWTTSVFPDQSVDSFLLPVKAAVRRAEGLDDGSDAEVVLELIDLA